MATPSTWSWPVPWPRGWSAGRSPTSTACSRPWTRWPSTPPGSPDGWTSADCAVSRPPTSFACPSSPASRSPASTPLGKALGLPVHALLGGKVRDAVEYSAYLFYKWAGHPAGVASEKDDWGAALDPAGVVAQACTFAERYGFASFELKGGVFPPEEEIAAIRALAEAFPRPPAAAGPQRRLVRGDLPEGRRGTRRRPGVPGGPRARHPGHGGRSPRGPGCRSRPTCV